MLGLLPSVVTGPDYGAQVTAAVNEGTGLITDNVVALLALPVLWVGYKVVRKIIAKIG